MSPQVRRAASPMRTRRPVALDAVLYRASAIGEHSLCWIGLAGATAMRGPGRRRVAARALVGLLAEELIVNEVLKPVFGRTRPAQRSEHPHWFRQPTDASFPSGHAAAAFCTSVLLSDHDRALAPAYFVLATTIAVSRWYVGAHHLSDVGAGVLVGTAIGVCVRSLWPVASVDPSDRGPEKVSAPQLLGE